MYIDKVQVWCVSLMVVRPKLQVNVVNIKLRVVITTTAHVFDAYVVFLQVMYTLVQCGCEI